MSTIDSRGTKIYFRIADTITRLECFKTIDMGKDDITTGGACLDDPNLKPKKEGRKPNEGSFMFVYDNENASHLLAFKISDDDEEIDMIVCDSDCTTEPTVTNGVVTFPTDGDCWVAPAQLHCSTPVIDAEKKLEYEFKIIRGLWTRIYKTT